MKLSEKISQLGKADLHIHSNYSDARPSVEKILEYVQNKTNLNVIAITDHDAINGALKAQKIAKQKKYRFEVVVGEEVSTKDGHILALFIKERIEPGLVARNTIEKIHKQGGIAIAAHPFYHTRLRSGRKSHLMDGIGFVTLIKEKENIDGIEVINATPTLKTINRSARFINDSLILKAETGSSDAHILQAIGKAYTVFEGSSAQELYDALKNGQTRAMDGKWNIWALLRYLFFFLPKGLRVSVFTLFHGRQKKQPKVINLPRS